MTLSAALQNSYSGLRAASTRAEVASNNIANAETDGFARREIVLSSNVLEGRGAGVSVIGVQIASAPVLTEDRWRADAEHGGAVVLSEAHDSVARIIGGPDDPGSLFNRYTAFENSLRVLSGDPAATHLQTDVLNKADDIVDQFNDMNDRLQQVRSNYDRQIGTAVSEINAILTEIADLNLEVRRDHALGNNNNETAAQRNMLIDEISEYMPVRTIEREDGQITLMTTSGYTLVAEDAGTLDFTSVGAVYADMDLAGGAPNGLSGLTLNGNDVTPPGSTAAVFTEGRLAALFEARDVVTVDLQDKIDAMARDLIERFNNTLSPGVEPALAAGDNGVFDIATGAVTDKGLAGQIRLNPLVAADPTTIRDGINVGAGDVGADAHIVALIDAFNATETPPAGADINGVHGAAELVAQVTSAIGEAARSADSEMTLRRTRRDILVGAERAAIGVDLDL